MGCANSSSTETKNMGANRAAATPGKPGTVSVSDVTLEYFADFYGRADSIRFMLHKAGVSYNYSGLAQAEWEAKKGPAYGEFPFMPKLKVGDKEYGQSMAILRAFGAKYGMYDPKDPMSAYYADVVVDGHVDILNTTTGVLIGSVLPKGGAADEGDFAKVREIFKKAHAPTLNILVANMKAHGGKYAAGKKVSIADCVMVAALVNIWDNPASPLRATFQECLAGGDIADKAALDAYFKTLRSEFGARLNDPKRTPKAG